jgi:type I restriction enzyme S subunit
MAMNCAQLFQDHFDTLAESPNAVDKLRKLVLQLAVQGGLGTQAQGEKVTVSIREIHPQIEPFSLPENWKWTQFGDVAVIAGGFAFKSGDYASSGVFVLRVTNIEPSGTISKIDSVFLPEEKVGKEIQKFYLNVGDILLVMVGGSLGKIGIVTKDVLPALLNQNLWRITPANKEVDNGFLKLLTDFTVSFQRKITYSTHGHLSREEFRGKPIALPPLAEQRRIVAKVEELLALCDELEARQAAAREHRTRLVRSALDHLTTAKDESDFKKHSAFCLQHSELLFDSVPALRQAILSLAAQGHLVPRNPKDEPASRLLDRIRAEKLKLVRERDLREPDAAEQIADEECPHPLPTNWQWVRLGEIQIFTNGFAFQSKDYEPSGVGLIRIGDIQNSEVATSDMKFISPSFLKSIDSKFQVCPGDLLIAMSGATTGKLGFNRTDQIFFLNQRVGRMELVIVEPKFAANYLATKIQENLRISSGSAIPNLSTEQINQTIFPLPPLAEQQRIVAKVDELMRWCDALEAHLTATQTASAALLDATLHQILNQS